MEKTYTFDFNLEAWLSGVEVEASSEKEARRKLEEVIEDALRNVGYVKNVDITDVDVDYNKDVVIKVKDITYDISEEDEEENDMTAEEIIKTLPTEMTIEVEGDEYYYYEKYGVEGSITEVIEERTGFLVDSFNYDVQEKEEE